MGPAATECLNRSEKLKIGAPGVLIKFQRYAVAGSENCGRPAAVSSMPMRWGAAIRLSTCAASVEYEKLYMASYEGSQKGGKGDMRIRMCVPQGDHGGNGFNQIAHAGDVENKDVHATRKIP